MKAIKETLAIAIMLSIPTIRNPLWHFTISIIPMSIFFIFWLIGGISLGQHALFGALVVFSINAGIVSLPQIAVSLKYSKIQQMFVASPVHPVTYALGIAISRLLYVAPPLVILLVILIVSSLLSFSVIPWVIIIILAIWFTGSMLGFTIATYFENMVYISSIANLLGLLLNLVPPVYYPLEIIPDNFQWFALVFPTVNAAQLIKSAGNVIEISPMRIVLHFGIIIVYCLISIIIVIFKSKWREP